MTSMSVWWLLFVAFEVAYVASLALIPHVFMRRLQAASAIAWTLAIIFLPVLGGIAYVGLSNTRVVRPSMLRRRRRLAQVKWRDHDGEPATAAAAANSADGSADAILDAVWAGFPSPPTIEERQLARLAVSATHRVPTCGNAVLLITNGDDLYDRIVRAVDSAHVFVHVEVYILRSDATGRRIVDALVRAARRGVEVRLLLDAFGSLDFDAALADRLRAAGVRVGWFFPFQPIRRLTVYNLRNHRKIIDIDGSVGFVGGFNIGDEYRAGPETERPWCDAHVRLAGPAVQELGEIFAEDWVTATGEDLSRDERYFPPPLHVGATTVHVVDSGPDRDANPLSEVIFAAITLARRRIRLVTPYFAPTPSLMRALRSAALRGVDVTLLLPSRRTDSPLAYYAGRWSYESLMQAGVRIFEHPTAFVHAKVICCDGRWGSVGSANIDARSMRLNFEANAFIISKEFAACLDAHVDELVAAANPVDLAAFRRRPARERIAESFARLWAPLV